MPGLKVGAADEIDRAQAGGYRPAQVDANQIGFGDQAGITLSKVETSQANPETTQSQREQRALRSFRQFESDGLQYDTENLEAFFDVSAHQQLRSGSWSQFQRASRRSCFGGVQK